MSSKISAALSAVQPGSTCSACVVGSGNDLNCIRAVLGRDPSYGSRGTLFVTPGSELEAQAMKDFPENGVRRPETTPTTYLICIGNILCCLTFFYHILFGISCRH